MSDDAESIVDAPLLLLLDASVAINFIDVHAWPMLLRLDGFAFATPRVVAKEIERKEQRGKHIRAAVANRSIRLLDEELPLELLAVLIETAKRLGTGDASVLTYCLALTAGLAADDRRLRNEAERRGVAPILGTEDLLAEGVRQRAISLLQGNSRLRQLREWRFDSRFPCLCELTGRVCACNRG